MTALLWICLHNPANHIAMNDPLFCFHMPGLSECQAKAMQNWIRLDGRTGHECLMSIHEGRTQQRQCYHVMVWGICKVITLPPDERRQTFTEAGKE